MSAAPAALVNGSELHLQVMLRSSRDRHQVGTFALTWSAIAAMPESLCCDLDSNDDASACSACIESWATDHLILATKTNEPGGTLPDYEVLTNRQLEATLELLSIRYRANVPA